MKTKMKRMLALTLALTMSAGLFGCGKSTEKKNDSEKKQCKQGC